MADVIHRTTYEYRKSVCENEVDYPQTVWLWNPDLSPVDGVLPIYWKVVLDAVQEMNQTEKDAVDAAAAAARLVHMKKHISDTMVYPSTEAASPDIKDLADNHSIFTDSVTQKKGPISIILPLHNERELLNPPGSPLYVEGFVGVVERVGQYDIVHGKTGWHRAEIIEAHYRGHENLLIFYAGLSSLNGLWNVEDVAHEMSKYGVIVLPATIEVPAHWDYTNTTAIIARIKELNPRTKMFGYADTTLAQGAFEARVNDWKTLGVHGIFMDRAGYDFGTVGTNGRAAFNTKVEYIHDEVGLVMANSWNMDHVLGVEDDAGKPNSTYNPSLVASKLTHNDWYLLESWPVNTQTADASYVDNIEVKADWAARGAKAIARRSVFGINLAAVGIIETGHTDGQALSDFHHISARMFSLDAAGTSDHNYGASSASAYWWTRPDFRDMGQQSWLNPTVRVDGTDDDIYWRYCQFSRLKLDFSSGAKTSLITKW